MKLGTDNQKAFTLIEMILAVGVASIVLITVNAVLYTAIHLRNATADAVDAAAPVDSTVTFLRRDLECCVTPTNGTSKVYSGGFRAGDGIAPSSGGDPVSIEMYTATGALNASEPWADIQRVTYELKNPANTAAPGKDLYRSVTRNLLPVATPEVSDQLMLSGVASVKFSCYDGTIWQPNWDTTTATAVNTNLPLAVKVDIQMAGDASLEPVEIVVPLDCVVRTNMVFASATGN